MVKPKQIILVTILIIVFSNHLSLIFNFLSAKDDFLFYLGIILIPLIVLYPHIFKTLNNKITNK